MPMDTANVHDERRIDLVENNLSRLTGQVSQIATQHSELQGSVRDLARTVSELHVSVKEDRVTARKESVALSKDIKELATQVQATGRPNWAVLIAGFGLIVTVLSALGVVFAFAIFRPNDIMDAHQTADIVKLQSQYSELAAQCLENTVSNARHDLILDLYKAGVLKTPVAAP